MEEDRLVMQGFLSVNDSLRTLNSVQKDASKKSLSRSPTKNNDRENSIGKLNTSQDGETLKSSRTFGRAGCFPAWKATALMAAKKRAKDLGAKNDLEQVVDNTVISSIYETLRGSVKLDKGAITKKLAPIAAAAGFSKHQFKKRSSPQSLSKL